MNDEIDNSVEMQPSKSEIRQTSAPNDLDTSDQTGLLVTPTDTGRVPSNEHAKQVHLKDAFWPCGIASLTVQVPESKPSTRQTANKPRYVRPVQKPRWASVEMLVYYAIVAFAIWRMILAPMRVSQEQHPNYWIYKDRLSDGWLFGRKVDNSDGQFRQFRNGLPSLIGLSVAYLFASKTYNLYLKRQLSSTKYSPSSPDPPAPYQKIPFLTGSSLTILFLLHGTSGLKILLLLLCNYLIPFHCRSSRVTPFLVWAYNIAILFSNEIFDGYHFGKILPFLSFLDHKSLAGLMPRWQITFNFTILRMISFSVDWYWSLSSTTNTSEKRTDLAASDFRPANYIAYILYPPLYIGGPIITFTSFMNQMKSKATVPFANVLSYAIRFGACWLTMEVIIHYMYVVAIKDSYAIQRENGVEIRRPAWSGDSPMELAMISFWNLVIVWLKLLLPWRFFRLWSLMDNIDPPENMIRCVLNNYSTRGFWRSWHRSYNLWLLRYLYVPIGGTSNTLLATLLVFTFVALWHDLSLKLLTWGWVITLFVLPEIVAAKLFPENKFGERPWYIHACALGAVFNIVMMIVANTIGFVLGPQNTLTLLSEVFQTWSGILFALQASIALFSAAHIMFEYREEELRRGIVRKC